MLIHYILVLLFGFQVSPPGSHEMEKKVFYENLVKAKTTFFKNENGNLTGFLVDGEFADEDLAEAVTIRPERSRWKKQYVRSSGNNWASRPTIVQGNLVVTGAIAKYSRKNYDIQKVVAGVSQFRNVKSIDFSFCKITDSHTKLLPWSQLQSINLASTEVKNLSHIGSKATNLRTLNLTDCAISNQGGEALSKIQNLEKLHLGGTRVDDGLRLKNLKLTHLYLHNTSVGDQVVRHLADCKSIEVLDLSASNITSASLALLREMPRLRRVFAADCENVISSEIKELNNYLRTKQTRTQLVHPPTETGKHLRAPAK